jgi:hypothetical protein
MSEDILVRLLMLGMLLDGKPELVQILFDASSEIERLKQRVEQLESEATA